MKRSIVAAAIVCGLLVVCVDARAAPKRGDRVSVTACVRSGVTANCLMIRDASGNLFNITTASPRPRVGDRMIRLRGVVSDKVSICGQGIVLERIRWTRTRQRCPN